MDIQEITFGIKDMVGIVAVAGGATGLYYAVVSKIKDVKIRMNTLEARQMNSDSMTNEKFLHAKNAKKANITAIYQDMDKIKSEVKEKEEKIYDHIDVIREEQKGSHEKMNTKLDTLSGQMAVMNANLAELTGYIRAKKEDTK